MKTRLYDIIHWKRFVRQIVESISKPLAQKVERSLLLNNKIDYLTSCALTSTKPGIVTEIYSDKPIVVSLTTYGDRFYDCYLSIESIMQGSILPNKIVLYLPNELYGTPAPKLLQNQMKRGLEVRYCDDIRSYTKLIYALKEYPDNNIVTIDDDILYPVDLLESLVNTHKLYPSMISANVVRPFPEGVNGYLIPLSKWDEAEYLQVYSRFVLEGYSGVLYPPYSLCDKVFDEYTYMNDCKTADDIWFSAMAMMKGTKVVCSNPHVGGFRYIDNDKLQATALSSLNVYSDTPMNDVQKKTVFEKCGIV